MTVRPIRMRASVAAILFAAALTPVGAQSVDDLAARGEGIANQDPLAVELRNRQPEGPARRGFDIGMAAAEGQTLPGPGKQRIHDSLSPAEKPGFAAAVSFSLERNRNADLASRGAAIARADPTVGAARSADPDVFFRLGFDIATGVFGNPALGGLGNTATGPGSLKIRDSLSAAGQRGFNAAVALHTREVVAPKGRSGSRPVRKSGTAAVAPKGTHAAILTPDLWKPAFIGNVQVTPGWKLIISFSSTQKTKPLVEVSSVAPARGNNGLLAFPAGSPVVSQSPSSNTGLYHAEFDVLREGLEPGTSYHYLIHVLNDDPNSLRERDQETGRFTMASSGNPSYVCVYRDGAEHVLGADGSLSNCSPFRCRAGQCGTICNVVSDCIPPFLCDGNGKCTLPPPRD